MCVTNSYQQDKWDRKYSTGKIIGPENNLENFLDFCWKIGIGCDSLNDSTLLVSGHIGRTTLSYPFKYSC